MCVPRRELASAHPRRPWHQRLRLTTLLTATTTTARETTVVVEGKGVLFRHACGVDARLIFNQRTGILLTCPSRLNTNSCSCGIWRQPRETAAVHNDESRLLWRAHVSMCRLGAAHRDCPSSLSSVLT